jgi:hypothetical protein
LHENDIVLAVIPFMFGVNDTLFSDASRLWIIFVLSSTFAHQPSRGFERIIPAEALLPRNNLRQSY